MFWLTKKSIIILLGFLLLLFNLPKPVFAQYESWAIQTPDTFMGCIDGTFRNKEICGQAYSGLFIPGNLTYGALCSLSGWPCSKDEDIQRIFQQSSVLNQTGNLIASLYTNPPANTGIWLADTFVNLGVFPKAYAQQGLGFNALYPLLSLWKSMRNVAYAVLIIILLVLGLMIMFRAKIDPRTVISVQAALPRIVVTLILITFSYPIAGLLIDLMYVFLFLGIRLIAGSVYLGLTPEQIQAQFASGGGLQWLFYTIPNSTWVAGIGGALLSAVFVLFSVGKLAGTAIATFLSKNLATRFGGNLLGSFGLTSALLLLLTIIVFLFAWLRIFFILLNSYINIIITVIFAPILLLGHAFPGQNQFQFESWVRNLVANLSVFPSIAVLLLVTDAVQQKFQPDNQVLLEPFWKPPLLPFFGAEVMQILIPLGFALAIPQLALTIKNLFGAKPVVSVGSTVGQAFSQPVSLINQMIQTIGAFKTALHK